MKQKRKKFVGIAKVKEQTVARFVKYRFNDPGNFIAWLQRSYDVLYVNIYSNREPNKGRQVAGWSKKQGYYDM